MPSALRIGADVKVLVRNGFRLVLRGACLAHNTLDISHDNWASAECVRRALETAHLITTPSYESRALLE